MTRVTLLYAADCPNWPTVDAWLRQLTQELGLEVERRQVTTLHEAEQLGFAGSPTVLIEGRDPFPSEGVASLSCRLYDTEHGYQGIPPRHELEQALRR